MAKWKLCFVLLLPLIVPCDSEETLVKTIGSKPDVTPVCTNITLNTILLIVCKIRTEVSGGEECRLLYRYGEDFVHDCDSRFTLMMENQTVFLHLSSLTPADSGSYTCECASPGATYMLHLNITVEGDEYTSISSSNSGPIPITPVILIGVTIVTIITGVIFGFFCRRTHCGCSRSTTSGLPACETAGSLDQADPDDPYMSLQQPAGDLYQTISYSTGNRTVCLDNQEMDERDTSWEIYENM